MNMKNDDLNSIQRNLETLLLLKTSQKFKDRRSEVREEFDIPEDGLNSEEEYQNWLDEIHEKNSRYISNQQDEDIVGGPNFPSTKFLRRIEDLRKEFNLPKNFNLSIHKLVLGKNEQTPRNFSFHDTPLIGSTDSEAFAIHIHAPLTTDDWEQIKKKTEKLEKERFGDVATSNIQANAQIWEDIALEDLFNGKMEELGGDSWNDKYEELVKEQYGSQRYNETKEGKTDNNTPTKKEVYRQIAQEHLGDANEWKKVKDRIYKLKKKRQERFNLDELR